MLTVLFLCMGKDGRGGLDALAALFFEAGAVERGELGEPLLERVSKATFKDA
jgi:hypothetical protein